MSDGNPPPVEVLVLPGGHYVRILGVTYAMALFEALAKRLRPGAHLDVTRLADGRLDLYMHRPGRDRVGG